MYKYRPCHFPLDGIHVHVRLLEPALQLHYPWTILNNWKMGMLWNADVSQQLQVDIWNDLDPPSEVESAASCRSPCLGTQRVIIFILPFGPMHGTHHEFVLHLIQKTPSFHRCTKQLAEWLMSTSCRSPFSMPSSVSKWTLSLQTASILMQKGGRTSRLHIDHIWSQLWTGYVISFFHIFPPIMKLMT